jgi:hypothetical protein
MGVFLCLKRMSTERNELKITTHLNSCGLRTMGKKASLGQKRNYSSRGFIEGACVEKNVQNTLLIDQFTF